MRKSSQARRKTEAVVTSVNQAGREYSEQLTGAVEPGEIAAEFERLSRLSQGHRRGWKFNREELHERG